MEDTTIVSGETGTVVVRWDAQHEGLAMWENCSLLMPPETEAIAAVVSAPAGRNARATAG
jgi:hypothetical protein